MKKTNVFLVLVLMAFFLAGMPQTSLHAEDQQQEAQTEAAETATETESETEHPATYYAEVQSNSIPRWPQGDAINAETAILMDADTGAILYAKDIDKREYPASITKIVTTMVALENGNLSDVVTFSANAVYSIEYGSSHLGLTEGEQLTMEQCLYGIMLASANEISNGVAEHIAGSIEEYVKMMNAWVEKLGCTNTHFVNVHGLHDEDHYTSARDMALIMQAALKNEKFREIISTTYYEYPKTNKVDETRPFVNHHKMITEEGMLYDGCIGGKTGYTDEAQNTLVTAAERNGQTLIAVVLRSPGLYVSYDDTKVLLDYGFDHFSDAQIEEAGSAPIKVTLPEGVTADQLEKTTDTATGLVSYSYEGQVMGSGDAAAEQETAKSTEAATETEGSTQGDSTSLTENTTQAETTAASEGSTEDNPVVGVLKKALGGVGYVYGKMDRFIDENTVVAAVIGAVLLVIFIPLLLVSIVRKNKYQKIMILREEEMETRKKLEEELEKKTAQQVEAELRLEELQAKKADEEAEKAEESQEDDKVAKDTEESEESQEDDKITEDAEEGAEADPAKEDKAETESPKAEEEITEGDEYIEVDPEEANINK